MLSGRTDDDMISRWRGARAFRIRLFILKLPLLVRMRRSVALLYLRGRVILEKLGLERRVCMQVFFQMATLRTFYRKVAVIFKDLLSDPPILEEAPQAKWQEKRHSEAVQDTEN
jgi:hypothetical protein